MPNFARFLAAAVLALLAAGARAAVDPSELLPIDQAYQLTAVAPERGRIEFTWKIADGYYLYRHRMSASAVDSSFKFNPLELPEGIEKTDEFFGTTQTYRDSVTAVLTGAAASGVSQVEFTVKYQGCADVGVCYPPHTRRITVDLPAEAAASGFSLAANTAPNPLQQALGGNAATPAVGTETLPLPPEEAFAFEAIASSPTELLMRFTPAPGYYLYRDRSSFQVRDNDAVALATPQWPAGSQHEDEHFGEVIVYFDQIEVPLPLRRSSADAQSMTLEATFQGCQTDGICYPPMTRRVTVALPQAAADQVVSTAAMRDAQGAGTPSGGAGLLVALLMAFAGGLILNLMPCVLPVLSLKAVSLAESGRSGGHARASALWYTAGVLCAFAAIGLLALALREAGLALGWGFQLQQPGIVALLALVVFAIGLNLSGVFEVGAGLASTGQSLTEKPGRAGDFFTGVLAVVVASPCTAPYMGTALAFAFAAPAAVALGVFLALGLGLALPFLLIGFVPALARALPRPGLWMETFKQVLAFPMYLTAVWLLWVLGKQRGVDAVGLALAGAVIVGAALWWWGRQGLRTAPLARGIALLMLAVGLSAVWIVHSLPPVSSTGIPRDGSEPYSAARLDALRAEGRTVFVNMTADWCVTCKANEKTVLSSPDFAEALQTANAVYLKGDWTDVDPEITKFLEAHGAVGVPLYVVFGPQGEGVVLPTVLSQAAVDAAFAQAAR